MFVARDRKFLTCPGRGRMSGRTLHSMNTSLLALTLRSAGAQVEDHTVPTPQKLRRGEKHTDSVPGPLHRVARRSKVDLERSEWISGRVVTLRQLNIVAKMLEPLNEVLLRLVTIEVVEVVTTKLLILSVFAEHMPGRL